MTSTFNDPLDNTCNLSDFDICSDVEAKHPINQLASINYQLVSPEAYKRLIDYCKAGLEGNIENSCFEQLCICTKCGINESYPRTKFEQHELRIQLQNVVEDDASEIELDYLDRQPPPIPTMCECA
jgi:hypothetical protein